MFAPSCWVWRTLGREQLQRRGRHLRAPSVIRSRSCRVLTVGCGGLRTTRGVYGTEGAMRTTARWRGRRSPVAAAAAAASAARGNARRAFGSIGAVLAKRAVIRAVASGRSIARPIIAQGGARGVEAGLTGRGRRPASPSARSAPGRSLADSRHRRSRKKRARAILS